MTMLSTQTMGEKRFRVNRAATSIHQWKMENPSDAGCLVTAMSQLNVRGMSNWPENKFLAWRTGLSPARMFAKFRAPFTKGLKILSGEGNPNAAKLLGMIKKPYDYKTVELPRTKVHFEAVLQIKGKDVEIDGFSLFPSMLTLRDEPHRLTVARVCRFDSTSDMKPGSIISVWRSHVPRTNFQDGRMLALGHRAIAETSLRQALRAKPKEVALIDTSEFVVRERPVEDVLFEARMRSGVETLSALQFVFEKKPADDPPRRMAYSIT